MRRRLNGPCNSHPTDALGCGYGNQRQTGSSWTTAGGDFGAAETITNVGGGTLGWASWNVTNMVQGWGDAGTRAYRFAFKATNEGTAGVISFRSRDWALANNSSLQPNIVMYWAR